MFQWLFGRKETPEQARRAVLQAKTMENLRNGGISEFAKERIEREKALGSTFFSTDLTVREHLLSLETNLKPLGQVMGTSFFNVSYTGLTRNRWAQTGELVDLTRAHLDARTLAMSRLRQEAELMGASGVIGVRIKSNCHEWQSQLTEFTAIGTAVKIPNWKGETFVSALSAQEFWQLFQAGYIPKDVAMGICSYYMYTDQDTRNMLYSFWGGSSWNNQEVPLYTNGLQFAREQAMGRLENDIAQHRAEGVVGMTVDFDMEHIEYEYNKTTYHDLIAHFVTMGTTIVHNPDMVRQPVHDRGTLLCIDLKGRRKQHGVTRYTQLENTTGGEGGETAEIASSGE